MNPWRNFWSNARKIFQKIFFLISGGIPSEISETFFSKFLKGFHKTIPEKNLNWKREPSLDVKFVSSGFGDLDDVWRDFKCECWQVFIQLVAMLTNI